MTGRPESAIVAAFQRPESFPMSPPVALDIDASAEARHSVLLGEEVRFALPNHFSAGYRWDAAHEDGALDVSRTRDAAADEPGADAPVGGGPDVVYAVRPLKAGDHALAFELRRPWEDGPRRVVRLTVRVNRPTVLDGLRA
jgi:predicted secreted protein